MSQDQIESNENLGECLRCVIYDMCVLAQTTETLVTSDDQALQEVAKTAALIKLRTVYDFFHRPDATDTIKVSLFADFSPSLPESFVRQWDDWLTHQSINTYVAHLDLRRVTKTIPQPKFERGEIAILRTVVRVLEDALEFVDSIINRLNVNQRGIDWLQSCRDSVEWIRRS